MAYLNWLFKQITAFLSIGTLNRDFYLKAGIAPRQIFLVPYTVDNRQFAGGGSDALRLKHELLDRAGVPRDTPILLYAAKFSDVKRPDDLVEAWRRILDRGRRVFILWVGDGPLRANVEMKCKGIAADLVHFAGFRNQSELPGYYGASDVFVLPSAVEPWGLVVNEAMGAALPIVTTEAAGCGPDLIQSGRNGRTVPVGDIVALADAIVWCLEHQAEASNASREIINCWSYKECEEGVVAALQAVLPAEKSRNLL